MEIKIINGEYDVLIIGGGGSGLAAAIFARRKGLKVVVISKTHPLKSHTVAAQGGINASLGNVTEDDWMRHAYDTIKASGGLADGDSVEFMCKAAPDAIYMLSSLGVEFDLRPDGKIDQKIYGGQSADFGKGELAYRACFAKDRTGHSIMVKLYAEAVRIGIDFYNYQFALDLLCKDDICFGVACLDIEKGIINLFAAKNTVIATGGGSQIFATTTSSAICTGDGNGLASRAGVNLQDMEFVQFHPTALNKIGILITEAARSAGGILLNGLGERFMNIYEPRFKELATRDVVARAIATEIVKGNGVGELKDHILLDLTHLSSEEIKKNLPTVFENCREFVNIDPSVDLIPIAPAAHYSMGGIPTDNNCRVVKFENQKDQIFKRLYAIGEAASVSVHGAGRLGCNSLLDLIVFANKVVDHLETESCERDMDHFKPSLINKFTAIFHKKNYGVGSLTQDLKNIMTKYVGVFRSAESLATAAKEIKIIERKFNETGIKDKSLQWNLDLQHYFELENMLISAKATVYSALWREESRGAHWRNDFQDRSDKYIGHTIFNSRTGYLYLRPVRKSALTRDFYHFE